MQDVNKSLKQLTLEKFIMSVSDIRGITANSTADPVAG